jgi:hypothetical protein
MGDDRQFTGRWRLVSWTAVYDDGRVEHPFGDRPRGFVLFGSDGWAAVQIEATERPTMSRRDPSAAPGSEQARAFATYLAYVARFEVREDAVALEVELSLNPQWVGTTQVRKYLFDDGELVLRPPPVEVGGQLCTHELRWVRDG